MATTVHIPKPLLEEVDRRARQSGLSRNRFIVQALEHEVKGRGWSPGFFERLAKVDPCVGPAVDEMMAVIRSSRRSRKTPVRL